jgi:Uma2 family endonuclease
MATIIREGMSIEEFMRIWDEEGPFEFIAGEKIVVPIHKMFGHGYITNKLVFWLNQRATSLMLGEAFVEISYILPSMADSTNWMAGARIPDLMFIRAEKLDSYRAANRDWFQKPLALVPDIVAEVVSPTDKFSEVINRIEFDLQHGVQLVWLIEPDLRRITIYEPRSKHLPVLTMGDTLTGGNVLPGFEVAVAKLFE